MKKAVFLLPLLAATYLFAFAAPAIYPAARRLRNSKKQRRRGPGHNGLQHPIRLRIYAFFESTGTEQQRAHRVSAREKSAMIMFKDSGYTVAIRWKENAKSDGTVIHVAMRLPRR
jgi:hypothetical protein